MHFCRENPASDSPEPLVATKLVAFTIPLTVKEVRLPNLLLVIAPAAILLDVSDESWIWISETELDFKWLSVIWLFLIFKEVTESNAKCASNIFKVAVFN